MRLLSVVVLALAACAAPPPPAQTSVHGAWAVYDEAGECRMFSLPVTGQELFGDRWGVDGTATLLGGQPDFLEELIRQTPSPRRSNVLMVVHARGVEMPQVRVLSSDALMSDQPQTLAAGSVRVALTSSEGGLAAEPEDAKALVAAGYSGVDEFDLDTVLRVLGDPFSRDQRVLGRGFAAAYDEVRRRCGIAAYTG